MLPYYVLGNDRLDNTLVVQRYSPSDGNISWSGLGAKIGFPMRQLLFADPIVQILFGDNFAPAIYPQRAKKEYYRRHFLEIRPDKLNDWLR